jgi:hypothetical protein
MNPLTLQPFQSNFVVYSFLAILVAASPMRRNATQQYTFADVSIYHAEVVGLFIGKSSANSRSAQITPTTDLKWFPCDESYFCAMLQVRMDLIPCHSLTY